MKAEDKKHWIDFEEFFIEFSLGYYFESCLRWPFGYWLFGGDDDDSLLWRGDADAGVKTIANTLKKTADIFGIKNYGVYLSPSWRGNIEKFRTDLVEEGWHNTFDVVWLKKELNAFVPALRQDDLFEMEIHSLKSVPDRQELIAVFDAAYGGTFGKYTLSDGAPENHILRNVVLVRERRLGNVVAMGFVATDGKIGHLYALCVLPEYRKRGLAKRLVEARLQFLQQQGVTFVVTAVVDKNAASLSVQEKMGYRIFSRTNAWQPKGVGSGAYAIDQSLQKKD